MAGGILDIDLSALARNWRALAKASGSAEAGAVVKADAYGLGMDRVAPVLAAAGARRFFVAIAEEGRRLRSVLGPGPEIAVFSGHMAGDSDAIRDAALIPMLNSPEQLRRHREALPGAPYGVQLDTGMSRLGVAPADWPEMRKAAETAVLVMSHLACSDEPDNPRNAEQLKQFRQMTDGLDVPKSFSATGGILLGADYHFDVTRPGIGLYGGAPYADAEPVVTLSLPLIQTRELAPGDWVGYGASFVADRPTRIATVSGGYADGLLRAMTGRGVLWHGDTPCPLAGRVSMDLMGVDVTDVPEPPEHLEILGRRQGVDMLADAAGTIGYEILTSLGPRYARRYHGG
ncbi:alanine racemase [Rhodobacterales bacterium HKCCE3408]|nr:alanine racemase [Rhodobacterales bacterium HKCCE3408]